MMIVHVTAQIVVDDVSTEVLDVFTDRLMDALLDKGVLDPDISGALARGEIEVNFAMPTQTWAEGQSVGPKTLQDAVFAAGVDPVGDWTDVPDYPNKGALRDLLDKHPDLVRRVNTELQELEPA